MPTTRVPRRRAKDNQSALPVSATKDVQTKPAGVTLTTFTLFPKLPLELRQMIWYSTLQPRVVEIRLDQDSGFYTTAALPVALLVSKEARDTVMKDYALCFGSIWYQARTRLNFDLDTIYLAGTKASTCRLFFSSLRAFEIQGIRSVAIQQGFGDWARDYTEDDQDYDLMAGLFTALESLPRLTSLFEVHDVRMWALDSLDWRVEFGWMDFKCPNSGTMEFHREIPAEIVDSILAHMLAMSSCFQGNFYFDSAFPTGGRLHAHNRRLPQPEVLLGIDSRTWRGIRRKVWRVTR